VEGGTSEIYYVKGRPTPWLDMEKKRIWNAHYVFYAQIKILVLKDSCLGKLCMKFLCYVCFASQIRFCG